MKCQIPQISWHSRDPVLSVDFQPVQSDQYRLASGGTDSHVLIWYVIYQENKTVSIECASDLYRHNKSVNVVRFSPSGEFLASGDDEGAMFIWQLKERELIDLPKDDDNVNKEEWYPMKLLRGHLEDIYDISWAKDGNFLVSASMDNTAIIWDMQKFVKVHIFSDFKGYVQGVSWDPCSQFIASVGSDRTLRIHNINSKKAVCRISKAPWTNSTEKGTFKAKLFYDDTLKSYCRRLTYTPDGELLIVPSGIVEKGEKLLNTCYIFSRHAPSKPVMSLPTGDKYTIAVRCNPFLYNLRRDPNKVSDKENDPPKPLINLPYRMIFAVAACDSILMYDTEQLLPFAYVSNIHYTHLTDLTWSPDGLTLVASSTDGYCSFIVFTREEIGEIYVPEEPKEIETDFEQVSSGCKTEKMDSTVLIDATSVPVVETISTPVRPKDVPSAETKSPKVSSQTPGEETATPLSKSANSIENRKSAKKSPKMLSIKNFFASPKTVVSASAADKNTEGMAKSSTEDISVAKSEPEVITLCDTPIKKGKIVTSHSSSDHELAKPLDNSESITVRSDGVESMEVDQSIADKSSSKTEKEAKCKVRLDFADESGPLAVNDTLDLKKSPKMSIKKFFMSTKSAVTGVVSDVDKPVAEIPIKKASSEKSKELELIASTSLSTKIEKCSNSVENASDKSSNKSKSIKCVKSSNKKGEAMDVDKDLSGKDAFNSGKVAKGKIEIQYAVNPIINIDENASDGDNTSTSMIDQSLNIDTTSAKSENDWKLELSQDEDIVPMDTALADTEKKAEVVQPSERKVTLKRRIPFVTLSSKATVQK